MPMPSLEIMFWKVALHKYLHIYTHIYMCEHVFTKTQSLNLALALQAHFREWCLILFWKRVFHILLIHVAAFRLFRLDSIKILLGEMQGGNCIVCIDSFQCLQSCVQIEK